MPGKLGTLWELMRGQRLRYALAILATLASVYFMYLVPLIGGATIDVVFGSPSTGRSTFVRRAMRQMGGPEALGRHLWAAAAAIVAARAVSGLLLYLKGHWSATAAESIVRRLRDRLYDHLQCLPCRYHDTAETGDLVQRCTSDVETIRTFLASQVVEVGRSAALLAMGVPFLLLMDTRMGLLSVMLMPPIIGFGAVFFGRVKDVFKQSDEAEGRMTSRLQENLAGIRVVRAFARQEYEIGRFAEANAEYRRRWYRLMQLMAWYWPISDLMCMAQGGIVLVAGAYYASRGRLTAGEVFAYLMYVNMFLWPVRNLGRILADMGKAVVSIGRVGEILAVPAEADAPAEAPPGPGPAVGSPCPDGQVDGPALGRIDIEELSFNHGPDIPVLRGLSLRVQPGATLAILGPAGSGKSTLINLLLRLYDYQAGSIRLDGQELRVLPRRVVRGRIGSVLQEPFLYSRSLRENITLARAEAREEEMQAAASAAGIHDSIQRFEHGYDTLVGERGVTLSGGQRQRVALARALLRDPPVLILDDALSAVDTQTEAMILRALAERRGRRTTIVIAHRLTTLMHADRIVVLREGRITQEGAHAELLAVEGIYRRLWQIQTNLAEDFAKGLEE